MLTSFFPFFVWQINAVHCGMAAQVPEYVSKAKLAWFGSHSRPEACLPLFREAVRSCEPASHDMSPQCVTVTKDFFVHGVCFKDFSTLDRCLLFTKYYFFLLFIHFYYSQVCYLDITNVSRPFTSHCVCHLHNESDITHYIFRTQQVTYM